MNEVVIIDEIAKQLGMASDQVSGHIAELWPMYVEASQVYGIASGFGSMLVFIVCLIGFILAYRKADKDDFETAMPIVCFTICGVCGFVGFILTSIWLPESIAFLVNPDGAALANLIDMLKG